MRVERALVELRPGLDLLSRRDEYARTARELVAMLLTGLVGDDDGERLVGLLDRDHTVLLGDLREPLRLARLEQLDDARQAVRDVRAGDAAGVERPHRQLRARLADRLRGDDPDRVPDLRDLAGRHCSPVAGLADPGDRLALEHGADRHHRVVAALLVVLAVALDDVGELGAVDLLALLDEHPPALGLEVAGRESPEQVVVGLATLLEDRHLDVLRGAAVGLANDHVLCDVDEAARQVTGVGGAKRRVREALARTVRRDEVLEHRETLHEVGLDRPLDDLALRVRHQAAHAGELADLLERAARSRVGHHEDRVQLVEVRDHRLGNLVGARVPAFDDGLVALLLGDQAGVVLLLDLGDLRFIAAEDLLLVRRHDDIVLGDRDPRLRRVLEAELLERVEHERDRRRAVALDERIDQPRRVALLHRLVDEHVGARIERRAESFLERPLDAVVVDDPPDRRENVPALAAERPELRDVVQLDDARLVGQLRLLGGAEGVRPRLVRGTVDLCELLGLGAVGQVVATEDHVLGRRRERRPVRRREDVVGGQHQDACLRLSLSRQRQVDGHLVAVEVSIERVTDERVDLDRLAFDEQRLERLDAEAVERRRAVQQHRMLADHLFEDVPDLRDRRVDHLLRGLDVLR